MSASTAATATATAAPDMASLYPPSVKFIPDLDIPVVSYGGDTSQFLSSNFPMTEIIPGLYSVTIPRGTLLYHSADIPEQPASDASINEKLAYVIKLLKGTTPYGTRATYSESDDRITLSGCHDQFNFRFFFFSVFPTIEFAITKNYIIEYETKHDIKLAITMSPSRFTKKGEMARSEANRTIFRPCGVIHKETNKSQKCTDAEQYGFDSCFTLEFLQSHGLSGQIQISDEESNQNKVEKYTTPYIWSDMKLPDNLINYKRKLTYGTFSADSNQQNSFNSTKPQYGPPEIVLYQFGATSKSNFEYSIGVDEGSSPEKTLMRHLLDGDSEQIHPLLQIRSIISHDRVIDFKELTQVPKYSLLREGDKLKIEFPFLGQKVEFNFPVIPVRKYDALKRLIMTVNYFTKYSDIENQLYIDPRIGSLVSRASEPVTDDGRKFAEFAVGERNLSQSVFYRLAMNPLPVKLDGMFARLNEEIKSSLATTGGRRGPISSSRRNQPNLRKKSRLSRKMPRNTRKNSRKYNR